MDKKIFQPEKYSLVICPSFNGQGYIQTAEGPCCLKCGGFGFVRKKTEKDPNTPTNGD